MLDLSSLPPSSFSQTAVFYAVKNTALTDSWQMWNKPRGCSWVYIFIFGPGGGGGSPNTGSVAGGGGGGGGGVIRGLIPAPLIPDQLFFLIGKGGLGATTANTTGGTAATASWIALNPSNSAGSGLIQVTGGAGGTATNGTQAGTINFYNYIYSGFIQSTAGPTSANGGASGSAGVSATYANTAVIPFCGAAGGAGYNGAAANAGGDITFSNSYPGVTIPGGTAGSGGTPGGNGGNGYGWGHLDFNGPRGASVLFFTGGSGGGCSSAAGQVGGNGGNGGYGCGGGGGGGASATPGNGGNGGDGLIIISTW